jgi:hypothetical protein
MNSKKITTALGITCLVSFGVCLAVLNITNVSTAAAKPGMTLSNVAVMQASAGESTCDASNTNKCTIVSGNITLYGTGVLTTNP